MKLIKKGISEAIAVIILSLVLTIGIFIAFAIGLKSIGRLETERSSLNDVVLEGVYLNPSTCSINISLRFAKPMDVQRITIVLDNNITVIHDFGFGETLYGLYIENISTCHRPIAVVITTVGGKSTVLRLG